MIAPFSSSHLLSPASKAESILVPHEFVGGKGGGNPNHIRQRGFTMIELMVVVAILAIVASITLGGVSQDKFSGAYNQFTDALEGEVVQGRSRAIDEQSRVRLTLEAHRIVAELEDPQTKVWNEIDEVARVAFGRGQLADDVCIHGLFPGVQVPGQVEDTDVPDSCLEGTQQLIFGPDGVFEVSGAETLDGAGTTLVIGDSRGSGVVYTFIEVYPGGLIRKFDHVEEF